MNSIEKERRKRAPDAWHTGASSCCWIAQTKWSANQQRNHFTSDFKCTESPSKLSEEWMSLARRNARSLLWQNAPCRKLFSLGILLPFLYHSPVCLIVNHWACLTLWDSVRFALPCPSNCTLKGSTCELPLELLSMPSNAIIIFVQADTASLAICLYTVLAQYWAGTFGQTFALANGK